MPCQNIFMSEHLEEWEAQQEARRAAAHKEGPLTFLAGGGTTASRIDQEKHRMVEELSHEAFERKMLFDTAMNLYGNHAFLMRSRTFATSS